jgi:MFS family permease
VIPKPARAGATLALLLAINTLNFFDRQVLGAVAEPIRREWHLTDTQLGWLGTAFTLLYALVGLPLGRFADRSSRRRVLSVGLFFWSGLTALSGLAVGFWSLFAARLGVGVGEAACAPASSSLIGDLYPAERRARALGVFMLGLPVGLALSYAVSGSVAQAYGWRAAFFVAGIPGCLLALVTVGFVAEPERGTAEAAPVGARHRPGSPWRLLLGIPTLWWIILSGALHNFNMYALSFFLPSFLIRTHGLDLRQAGFVTAVLIGVAGGVGLFTGGALSDRLHRSRPNGRLWLATCCALGSVPFQLVALSQPAPRPQLFLVWMLPAVVLIYVYYATVYSAIHDVVEPGLRGTAMAIYFCAMYLLGGSFGPVGAGFLSDVMARRAAAGGPLTEAARAVGLHHAMYVIPTLAVLLGLVLWRASRTVVRDRAHLETWMARETATVVGR